MESLVNATSDAFARSSSTVLNGEIIKNRFGRPLTQAAALEDMRSHGYYVSIWSGRWEEVFLDASPNIHVEAHYVCKNFDPYFDEASYEPRFMATGTKFADVIADIYAQFEKVAEQPCSCRCCERKAEEAAEDE